MSIPQYCRSRHNPGLARKNPQDDGCQGANLIEEDKQGTPPEPLIDNTELISLDEWKAFLDAIPDEIWTSKFSNTRHINAANGIFPMVGLDKTETLKSATVKQFKNKMYALSSWEITKLFTLGNPTIPEAQGGLTFEDICRHVHSSGRTDVKSKPFPPKFFLHPDSGNNYSVALRRIYYYVNLA